MVSTTPSKTACYISILNIIQGDVDPTDVRIPIALRLLSFPSPIQGAHFAPSNSGTSVGQLHPMGAGCNTSSPDEEITLHRHKPPREWAHVSKPHKHSFCTQINHLAHRPQLTHPQLFKRMIDQFDRLRRRNAFMEQYKKEKIFENSLAEFDDARCITPHAHRLVLTGL